MSLVSKALPPVLFPLPLPPVCLPESSLWESAFFPGGGGQHCDLGYIDNHKVINVIEENGQIYHVTETKPIKIHRVNCKIDWNRRLDGMQQHLGQHILSGCFFTLFNANTVSVHVGKEISTVDIQGYLDEESIRKAVSLGDLSPPFMC